jgi:hypothetical protein
MKKSKRRSAKPPSDLAQVQSIRRFLAARESPAFPIIAASIRARST